MQNKNCLFTMLIVYVLLFILGIKECSAGESSINTEKIDMLASNLTAQPLSSEPIQTMSQAPIVSSKELIQGWSLASANNVNDNGIAISQRDYNASSWYSITIPSTVLAGLVTNNVYKDIYFGTNLQSVPDLTAQNWWYRVQFDVPTGVAGQQYWLRFKGISYRAQIWLNGTQIDSNAVGSMVVHEYNVTNLIHPRASNVVALLITPPSHGCKNLSFCTVDWNPEAPDMNAGLWGKVFLDTTGAIALRDPYVKAELPLPATNSADLTVYVDAVNSTNTSVNGTVTGTISKSGYPTISFSQNISLNPNERREITFDRTTFTKLHVNNPALWWPYQFGNPDLYQLDISFIENGNILDKKSIRFGIRQFTDYRTTVNDVSFVGYKINGQNILFRGGGYVWDMLQRWDTKTNQTHIQYVKEMGLNAIRLEGTLGNEELYDLADEYGIMILPGFVCCSRWAEDSLWDADETVVAYNSLDSQMRSLRFHACPFVWAYGSDNPPGTAVLDHYKTIATTLHWQNPTLDNVNTGINPNAGVKMDGPYVWEPPLLWWDTNQAGSAFGTTAEEGFESPPPLESQQKFLATADLWPQGDVFNYHAGRNPPFDDIRFDNIHWYTDALNNRYGATTSAADYSKKSELLSYESTRAFFEAWNGNEYIKTFGTIFWMQNNAWPSVHWNLYDYYFKPAGGYFGTKKANEPVHILYDYFNQDVKVVNSKLISYKNMTASVTVYNIPTLERKYSNQVTLNIPANESTKVFTIPPINGLTTTYFIRLQLKDSSNQLVSNNLYWYSTTPDSLGKHLGFQSTAVSAYADMTGLNKIISNGNIKASVSRKVSNGQETATIVVKNKNTSNIAFFMHAEVTTGKDGIEVLPIIYTENYISLFPTESITITAKYSTKDLAGQSPYLRIRGYNVPIFSLKIP